MSADFPNRDFWLKVRASKSKKRVHKILHFSARIVHIKDPETGLETRSVAKGTTYRNNKRNTQRKVKRLRRARNRFTRKANDAQRVGRRIA